MLDWQGGQPFSRRFEDIYFSKNSGLEEKRNKFLQGNRLGELFRTLPRGDSFAIGEIVFGTGLSFLCAWQLFHESAPSTASLDFFSVEKFPLEEHELARALSLWPHLQTYADRLAACWQRRVPGWNRWHFDGGRVRLTLALSDIAEALPEVCGQIDAWFLDGFSPARNPEMWSEHVFRNIAKASRAGATFATYTSAGWVRRGLEQAGFHVDKLRGFGHKREMLRGSLSGSSNQHIASPSKPAPVIIVGGGISGCAAASAFAARNVPVTLLESAGTLSPGASGNPVGILHARLSAGMNTLQRFVLASYGHALALLDEKLPIDGGGRRQCGELQLAFSADEAKRIDKLSVLESLAHIMQRVDAAEASRLAGIELSHGGLWLPSSGWVVPPRLCAALTHHRIITPRTSNRVTGLRRMSNDEGKGWRVDALDGLGHCQPYEAEAVVVCTGYQSVPLMPLMPFTSLPLTPVRGQLTLLPPTPDSEKLNTILSAAGYITPKIGGVHVAGATHSFNDAGVDLRMCDHGENLARLADISPALTKIWNPDNLDLGQLPGRASVRASLPGAMPLVGELLPGLYASAGHGTRGLITAGLSGELIASAACGELLPLPLAIVKALGPVRWLKKV
jgi:tRNA 5-methylaminomethyl-2-thiouridine biosynthesis bifunctional protein